MAAGSSNDVGRRNRWWGRAAVLALAVAFAACGQSVQTQLPDLAARSTPLPSGRPTLSSAEQKQAIDRMIAKRDAMEKEQPK